MPFVRRTSGAAPGRANEARLTAMRVTVESASSPVPPGMPSSPRAVERSTARSAVRVWPATVRVAPRRTTRTYGPAGRPWTGVDAVLTATETAPLSARPGTVVVTVAASSPATPAAPRVRVPTTPARTKVPGPTCRPPPETVRRVVEVAPEEVRSMPKVPLTCWLPIVRVALVATRRR